VVMLWFGIAISRKSCDLSVNHNFRRPNREKTSNTAAHTAESQNKKSTSISAIEKLKGSSVGFFCFITSNILFNVHFNWIRGVEGIRHCHLFNILELSVLSLFIDLNVYYIDCLWVRAFLSLCWLNLRVQLNYWKCWLNLLSQREV